MPPLPPNLSRTGIIRTTPSWNQRTMSLRNTHIRHISSRFPSEPSCDTGWVNPSLPPGAARLAIPKMATANPRPIFCKHVWELVDTLPLKSDPGNTVPFTLSLAKDVNVMTVGYPAESSGVGLVRTYEFDGMTKSFVQKGQDLNYAGANEYAAGTGAAVTADGSVVLVGIPSELTGSPTPHKANGLAIAYLYDGATTWNSTGSVMYYVPEATDRFYGYSVAYSGFSTATSRWYSTAGVPGANTLFLNAQDSDGIWQADIGTTGALIGVGGAVGTGRFGAASDVSDLTGGAGSYLYTIAGAPGQDGNDDSYFRIARATEDGDGPWTPWTAVYDSYTDFGPVTGTLGTSVAMVADGTLVIAGDPTNGNVYVYSSTTGNPSTWSRLGPVIQSEHIGTRFGQSVGVDRDASGTSTQGTTIVVGEPDFNAPGRPLSGRVVVLEYIETTWHRVLNGVNGTAENEHFGETVAMVASDRFAAAGNRDSGRVAVYTSSGDLN